MNKCKWWMCVCAHECVSAHSAVDTVWLMATQSNVHWRAVTKKRRRMVTIEMISLDFWCKWNTKLNTRIVPIDALPCTASSEDAIICQAYCCVAVHFGTYTANDFANNYHPKMIETVLPHKAFAVLWTNCFFIAHRLNALNARVIYAPRVYVRVCVFFLHGRRFITLCAVTCIVKIIYYPCETYNHDCIIVVTLIGAPKR